METDSVFWWRLSGQQAKRFERRESWEFFWQF